MDNNIIQQKSRWYQRFPALALLLVYVFSVGCGFTGWHIWQNNIPDYVEYTTSANYTVFWQLGDDIIPYPAYQSYRPNSGCCTNTLYSYLYIQNMAPGLDIKIMKGYADYAPGRLHSWLLVDDAWIYDMGMAFEADGYGYKGTEVSYKQLVQWVLYHDIK